MSLSAKDLIKVARACKKLGAKRIKTADLEIEFEPGEAALAPEPKGETVVPPTETELVAASELAAEKDLYDRADEELVHMQVEDPVQFEQMVLERQVEELVGDDGGDEFTELDGVGT